MRRLSVFKCVRMIVYRQYGSRQKFPVDIAKSDLDTCIGGQKRENDKLQELEDKCSVLVKGKSTKIELLTKSYGDFKQVDQEFKGVVQCELIQVTDEEADLTSKITKNRAKSEKARKAYETGQSRNVVLTTLLEEQRKGTINGVIGRLGDLGAIDEQYDLAISAACGALDSIVVDSLETAEMCVKLLEKTHTSFDQTKFIVFENMGHIANAPHENFEKSENALRLFDLLQAVTDFIKPAFYFALKDTFLQSTLKQSTRAAFQDRTRWRVVTLQGHVLEPSGTMDCGVKQTRDRMGHSVALSTLQASTDQLKRLDALVSQDTERLNSVRQRRIHLEKMLESHVSKSRHLEDIIEKCSREISLRCIEQDIMEIVTTLHGRGLIEKIENTAFSESDLVKYNRTKRWNNLDKGHELFSAIRHDHPTIGPAQMAEIMKRLYGFFSGNIHKKFGRPEVYVIRMTNFTDEELSIFKLICDGFKIKYNVIN